MYFSGIPIGVFQSMFQVVALETFKLPADQNGLLMSYIGILTMVRYHTQNQGSRKLENSRSEPKIRILEQF